MSKQIIKICKKCGQEGYHEWEVDKDSDPETPIFYLNCLNCGFSEQAGAQL